MFLLIPTARRTIREIILRQQCSWNNKDKNRLKIMMLSTVRLRIVDYFESLVNQIDLKAETLIIDLRYEKEESLINEKRKQFIDEIKQIEDFNLRNLNNLNVENLSLLSEEEANDKVFAKFCFIVYKSCMEFSNLSQIDSTLGFLILLEKYIRKDKLQRYKELLKLSCRTKLHFSSNFFNSKYNKPVIYYDPTIHYYY